MFVQSSLGYRGKFTFQTFECFVLQYLLLGMLVVHFPIQLVHLHCFCVIMFDQVHQFPVQLLCLFNVSFLQNILLSPALVQHLHCEFPKLLLGQFLVAAQARIYDSDGLGGLVFVFSAQFTGISCSAQGLERHYLFKMATLILTE